MTRSRSPFDDIDAPPEEVAQLKAWWKGLTEAERLAALPCCDGVVHSGADNGGQGCTCWEPVYDVPQVEPVAGVPVERASPCSTCACHVVAGALPDGRELPPDLDDAYGWLVGHARTGQPFYCHQGMRRRIAERHPHYPHVPDRDCGECWTDPPHLTADPPHLPASDPADATHGRWRDGPRPAVVPYKADGTPADICAAWRGLRARLQRAEARSASCTSAGTGATEAEPDDDPR